MAQRKPVGATVPFSPGARVAPPAGPPPEIVLAAPRIPAEGCRTSWAVRLLPVLTAVAAVGMMLATFHSGAGAGRHPMLLVFPVMMLLSAAVSAVSGRGARGGRVDDCRSEYLNHLAERRVDIVEATTAQRVALSWRHPDPESLWTLIGGRRMWERRATDVDFCDVRVGSGTVGAATTMVVPDDLSADPVIRLALEAFSRTHAAVADTPVTVALRANTVVSLHGDSAQVRTLLRAIVCQCAVLHPPGDLLIAAVTSTRSVWDWLKWLPHNQHPGAEDGAGPARMVYTSWSEAKAALGDVVDRTRRILLIVDGAGQPVEAALPGVTVLDISAHSRHSAAAVQLEVTATGLVIRQPGAEEVVARCDRMREAAALACARLLAAYDFTDDGGGGRAPWQQLAGIPDLAAFDPAAVWRDSSYRNRLRVPVGTTPAGAPVELDIKEAADGGIGPHGLCIGATGSGKSELLRTVALGMIARHSPEILNLVLVDFKGGATFRGLEPAPHVAAVITNLSDDALLVERMREALAGEMNRRQEILRAAGNFVSVAAYEQARLTGGQLCAVPVLFIIVDEFSELLSQQPDFADMFAAIGRLGRSLGMHLLLASQRLDEGRLRGLESHLSYRVCLKTLTANESRTVLGGPDAYHLPAAPGAAYLRHGAGDVVRFQCAFVSGRVPPERPQPEGGASTPQPFTSASCGAVRRVGSTKTDAADGRTVLQTVVQRLGGCGPHAHQVWLPPLAGSPALDTVLRHASTGGGLRVPIGSVDRPFDQKRTALTVELDGAAGNVAVVGAPQSGKTTALRTLVTALAASQGPDRVQFYCLDFGGGALASLRALPHVGSVAGRAEPELVARTIGQLESLVRRRERAFGEHGLESMAEYRQRRGRYSDAYGDVFLVVDGWAAMRRQFETLDTAITALAVQGLSVGVHVVVSASRWADIRPAMKDAIGTRIELRLGDPAESEVDRKRAQRVPKNSPGRGLWDDGLHMAIAVPRLDGVESCTGLSQATLRLGRELRHRHGDLAAPPVLMLPTLVDHQALRRRAGAHVDGVLLGVEANDLQPVAVDFDRHAHLLVSGDNRCGKTATLRTLCRELIHTTTAAQVQLFVVDFRRGLLDVATAGHLGGYAPSAPAAAAVLPGVVDTLRRRLPPAQASPEQLRNRRWWTGPDVYVVVDDYELVAGAGGNPLTPLVELLPYAADLGLHLILARRSAGAARAMFEPLLTAVRDAEAWGLVMSGSTDDGPLLGSARPSPLPPGRGVLVASGVADRLVQVGWTPES